MARIQRQELKRDEFVDSFDSTLLYIEDNWPRLLAIALAVLLGGGAAGGYYWYSQRQESRASVALASALFTFRAPVQAGLPALPGEGPEQIFTSEEDKYRAAEAAFEEVQQEYPRTKAALLAQHYQAVCYYELGETEKAISAFEALARSGDANVAALARYHLAGLYLTLGRRDDAARLYRELSEKPTATVPKSMALLELARLEAENNPQEARRLFELVKNEFPDSPIAAEVTRELEELPPARP